jgi:uncharacterized glyoxalase superfamily protein PhnB
MNDPVAVQAVVAKVVAPSADEAIEFYTRALGLRLEERYTVGGAVVFAELRGSGVRLQVKDADDADPAGEGRIPLVLTLECADAVATAARLVEAGAVTVFEVADQGYGMIQGRVVDPYAVQWLVSETVEDLTPEQVQQRLDQMSG